jgi:dienelactone hydrolase
MLDRLGTRRAPRWRAAVRAGVLLLAATLSGAAVVRSLGVLGCNRGLNDLGRDETGVATEVKYWPRTSERGDTRLEDISFRARSNEIVHGTLAAPLGAKAAPSVLYLHRASETRAAAVEIAADLVPQGFVVFAIDMPGFGTRAIERTPSDPSGLTWFLKLACEEARDAIALLRELPEVDPDRITVMGASLGARVAALVASHHQVHATILLVPGLARLEMTEDRNQMTLRAFREIEGPILVISASEDTVVPKEMTEAVLLALHAPVHKVTPGSHHFPFTQVAGDVVTFLREADARPAPDPAPNKRGH